MRGSKTKKGRRRCRPCKGCRAPHEAARTSSELGLHLLDDAAKSGRIVHGHVGKDLAVDVDLCLLQAGHELAVGQAETPARRVDAGDPELAENTLLGTA